jgi:hypothetical protein
VSPACGGGVLDGGDTGESVPATVRGVSTTGWCFGAGGRENVSVMRLGLAVSTLLGPEGTTGTGPCGWWLLFQVGARHGLAAHTA